MKGMILAAGYGTRFRPATYEIPKPMIPVCNRPLIAWAVEPLLAAGVSEIVVNLHHLPAPIEQYLTNHYGSRCKFVFSFEPEILGTGGGVRNVRHVLAPEESFFLVNGDTVQKPPFGNLLSSLKSNQALATLLLRHAPPDDQFTPVMFDGRFITGFGNGKGEPLMFAGAHAISSRIFEFLPDRAFSGLTEDVYAPLIEKGRHKISGVVHDGPWFDIGTPRRYQTASAQLLDHILAERIPVPVESRIDRDTRSIFGTESAGTADRCVVGGRCHIANGSSVRRSVLWDAVTIESEARIERSIIGNGVSIPARSRMRNLLVCRRLPGVSYDKVISISEELVAAAIVPDEGVEFDLRGS